MLVPEHAAQVAPFNPHALLVWEPTAMHVVPLQQPVQLVELQVGTAAQAPAWHVSVPAHAVHAAPFLPHCDLLSLASGTQVVPLQQPAQLLELHDGVVDWQAPFTQVLPTPHA